MVILSVDYGDARTGIAVCDKLELLASPATVLAETYAPKLARMIAEEAKSTAHRKLCSACRGIWMEAKASARKNAVRLPCNWKKHAVFPLGFGMND